MSKHSTENNNVDYAPKKKSRVNQSESKEKRPKRLKKIKYRRRRFPILLRVIVVLLLLGASLAAGLAIGYGIIGDGSLMDVFQKETWQHIIDIVKSEK